MIEFNIRRLINIIIAVFLAVLAVKLFIWALPIIIIILLANYIYKIIKRVNINIKNEEYEVEKIKRSKTKNTSKNKKIIIIDEENNN